MKLRSLLSLSASISALAPICAYAQAGPRDEIIVTALPLQTTAVEADTPVVVLTGDDLHHLFDELAFNHSSFIKNASPLRGQRGLRPARRLLRR